MRFRMIVCGLILMSAGALLAQQETPTPDPAVPTPTVRPVDLACDLEALRDEQQALAAQLDSFGDTAGSEPGIALDNLFKVGAAYQELALRCGYIPADAGQRPVGAAVERILAVLADLNGDPLNGQYLYNTEYSCAGCHEGENRVAPPTEGTYTRVIETRLADPQLEGYTAEQYLVESIVNPAHYIPEGYQNVMPHDFGERLTAQELADLLLFLESQDGPSPD